MVIDLLAKFSVKSIIIIIKKEHQTDIKTILKTIDQK